MLCCIVYTEYTNPTYNYKDERHIINCDHILANFLFK